MEGNSILMLFFAVLGGMLPPLIWLWFWLKEDNIHPEPKVLVAATFIGGAMAVPIALYLETLVATKFPVYESLSQGGLILLLSLFLIVIVEEGVKFVAAKSVAFSNKNFDEPVDALIYLISAALGFAALENVLFLINNLSQVPLFGIGNVFLDGSINGALISNNLRFIGANVLHVVASGMLGVFIGLSFYKPKIYKFIYIILGFVVAILLHLAFNYFIINFDSKPIAVFSGLWIFAIVLILLFERVKHVHKTKFIHHNLNTQYENA